MPPPKPTRPYSKTETVPAAPPAPLSVWALGLVPCKRLGNDEVQLVAYEITGDRCVAHPLPDGNYDRIEDALGDLRRAATQGFRFKAWRALIGGRV